MFLGTPFRGSTTAKYFEVLRHVAEVFRDTNSSKIQDLNEKSKKLELLVERFTSRLRQRQTEGNPIEVQFFYETLKTKGVLVSLTRNLCIDLTKVIGRPRNQC